MAAMDCQFWKVVLLYLILSVIMFSFTFALYEDQIGLFDWKKSFVGKIKYVHFDGTVANSKRVLVASEDNAVLGALNSRTGQLIWRRVLERSNNTIDKLLHFSDQLISLSGQGRFLRSWETSSGNLIWESNVLDENLAENNQEKSSWATGLSSTDCVFINSPPDSVVVLTQNKVKLFSVDTGTALWSHEASGNAVIQGIFNERDSVSILGTSNREESFIRKLNVKTGVVENEQTINAPWLYSQETSCIIVAGAVVCVDPLTNTIHCMKLAADKISLESTSLSKLLPGTTITSLKLSVPHSPTIRHQRTELVLHLTKTHSVLLKVKQDLSISVLKEFATETLFFASVVANNDAILMTASISTSTAFQLSCYNLDTMKEIEEIRYTVTTIPEHHGQLEQIYTHFFFRKDGTIGYRVLALFQDYSLSMIQHTGRLIWTREESLASITAVEMVELPISPEQANFEALQKEFGYHHDGKVLSMFTQRIQAQFQQFQAFVASLNIDREELLSDSDEQKNGEELTRDQFDLRKIIVVATASGKLFGLDSNGHRFVANTLSNRRLTRDQFDLRKIIVVATASGKLFGLDSNDGSIIWQRFLSNMAPFHTGRHSKSLLYLQRSVAHFPLIPQYVVVGRSRSGQGTVLFIFNPSNGKSVDENFPHGTNLPYDIVQTILLPYHDEKYCKILLVVDTQHNAYIFPGTEDASALVKSKAKSIFLNIVDNVSGEINGYVLNADLEQLRVQKVWNIQLSTSEHVIDQTVFKRLGEHVHSPGRVLGDRRVLYKYLNPNLMTVLTRSPSISKPIVNILLIDSVTGSIVYHGRHRNAHGPLHVVHSENWIIYKYYNTKARRHELAVLELYEGHTERNSTAFSSFDPPLSPMVLHQSYIFPFSVESMTTTITNAGITKKNLLFGVSLGYIYALPKMFLDPRRNLTDSPRLREEGLMPYVPELPLITQSFINYNQTVSNMRGIYTSPAGLESTCLVFAYGLDLYFTRITPSKLFDVLKEDFDYWFIAITLLILAAVTMISSRLASVKVLRQMWH